MGKWKGTDNKDSMGTLVVAKALHLEKVGQEVRGVWEARVAHSEVLQCGEKVVQGEDAIGVQAH